MDMATLQTNQFHQSSRRVDEVDKELLIHEIWIRYGKFSYTDYVSPYKVIRSPYTGLYRTVFGIISHGVHVSPHLRGFWNWFFRVSITTGFEIMAGHHYEGETFKSIFSLFG